MTYRDIMESLTYNAQYHTEANEFIKREIHVWGEDYVDDLFDKGYVPVKLSNSKWSWLLDTESVNSVALTY